MLELKSCPHCNGNGRIVSVSGFKSDRYRAVCEQCGASTRECETKQEAVSAWNMRAGGWIPVGERLPDETKDEYVLVACEYYDKITVETRKMWHVDSVVTHWQSLPEPPKGAKGEKDD